jgi:hypothetical protein
MYAIASLTAACGDNLGVSDAHTSHFDGPPKDSTTGHVVPRVVSTIPGTAATNVPRNTQITATFNEPMDTATLVAGTITLSDPSGAVVGSVTSTNTTITFVPGSLLAANTVYTATVTTAARSADAVALAAPMTWMFTTGTTMIAPGVPVDLGTSSDFVLIGKAGITNVPISVIRGNIGVSPIDHTAITGMPLTPPDVSAEYSTTPQVIGRVYAADYAVPTPTKMTLAVMDMETAFDAAAARAPDVTELGAGMIGTVTLAPGVYKWSTALLIPTSITLSGSSTDVWIFQIAQGLTLSTGTQVVLAGGALPKNVFWQAAGEVVVNTGAHLEGNVLTKKAATLDTGASLNGRLLAQTLVTVRASTITVPAP